MILCSYVPRKANNVVCVIWQDDYSANYGHYVHAEWSSLQTCKVYTENVISESVITENFVQLWTEKGK